MRPAHDALSPCAALDAVAIIDQMCEEYAGCRRRKSLVLGCVRLLSARHDFSTEWAQFTSASLANGAQAPLTVTLQAEHYPYWSTVLKSLKLDLTLHSVDLIAQPAGGVVRVFRNDKGGTFDELKTDNSLGGRRGQLAVLPAAIGTFTRYFDDNTMDDIWIVLTWGAVK